MEGDDRRRSFSQVVIGFSEEQSETLRDQDESFYGYSGDSSESDDSSDSSDTAERSPLAGGYVGSDAEENLNDSLMSPVAASEASALGAPAAAANKTKRAPSVESSLADVEKRRTRGCDCRGGNCFLNVSAEDLKTARNLTEELDKASRLIFISGKLDTLANRGEFLQHASAARRAAASRARVSYRYEVNQTKVCLAVILHILLAVTNSTLYSRTLMQELLCLCHMAMLVSNRGMLWQQRKSPKSVTLFWTMHLLMVFLNPLHHVVITLLHPPTSQVYLPRN